MSDELISIVFAGAILEYFGAPDIEPEGSPEHPDKEASGPSRTSGPPSDMESSSAHLHGQQPIFARPGDPADWPSVLSNLFRTDARGRG